MYIWHKLLIFFQKTKFIYLTSRFITNQNCLLIVLSSDIDILIDIQILRSQM